MAITISGSGITSSEIADGTITNADINASAGIVGSKLSGAGKILQVVYGKTSGSASTTSTAWQDTAKHSESITVQSSTSSVWVSMTFTIQMSDSDNTGAVAIRSSLDGYTTNLFECVAAAKSGWMMLPSAMQFLHTHSQSVGTSIGYRSYIVKGTGLHAIYIGDSWGSTPGAPTYGTTLMEIET